jgi:hypothetical protein
MECFAEVAAECNTYGAYAAAVPMCQFDWSDMAALNPDTFMQIIKASVGVGSRYFLQSQCQLMTCMATAL